MSGTISGDEVLSLIEQYAIRLVRRVGDGGNWEWVAYNDEHIGTDRSVTTAVMKCVEMIKRV